MKKLGPPSAKSPDLAASACLPLGTVIEFDRLPALDGLRAVAVLVVVVYHAGFVSVPGDLGVSAFFVLSGFLITWLLLKEHRATTNISLGAFYLRRVLRIFPAYYVFLMLSFAADYVRGFHWPMLRTFAALSYTMNYYNALTGDNNNGLSHTWSLAIEEQFYLLWPLMLLIVLRRRPKWATPMLTVTIAVVIAWRSFAYVRLGLGPVYVYNALDTRFDNLMVGCLFAMLCFIPRFQQLFRPRGTWIPILSVLLILISRKWISVGYHYSLGYTIDATLMATIILFLIQRPWAPLEDRIVRYIGAISYPVYLYHVWGLGLAHKITHGSDWLILAIGLPFSIGMASCSYFFVERPFLAIKKRLSRGTASTEGARIGSATFSSVAR